MLPSQLPAVARYRAVNRFFRKHLDMQFADVRTLMKLPRPKEGLPAGCNFVAAAAIANLLGGISEVLYSTSAKGPGPKVKALIEELYPWQPAERRRAKAKVLYHFVRNPLVHNLGIDDPNKPKKKILRIPVRKSRLTHRQLTELEKALEVPPPWAGLAVRRAARRWNIYVPALYWGAFHLLRRLTEEPKHMQHAELLLSRYRF